jgi:hypothetical protein
MKEGSSLASLRECFAMAALAIALVLAAARCGVNVELGVAPPLDGGETDAGASQ